MLVKIDHVEHVKKYGFNCVHAFRFEVSVDMKKNNNFGRREQDVRQLKPR